MSASNAEGKDTVMRNFVAVLVLAGLAIAAGQLADAQVASQFADGTAPLMYAGVRG